MEAIIKNIIEGAVEIVSLGIILHYFAFMIAWGVRKAQAKIPVSNNITIGREVVALLTEKK